MNLPIQRNWLGVSEETEQTENSIRVLQWNVLADALSASSPTENFCAVPQHVLSWTHRSSEIISQIKLFDADIICLQEVDHYKDCFEIKLDNYSGVFMEKKNSPCLKYPNNNGPDGIAIFFKSQRFINKENVFEYLHEESGKEGSQGVIIVVLEDTLTGKYWTFVNVHLKAKIGFEFKRAAQVKSAVEKILPIKMKYPNAAIVWCGDFNGEYDEPFYEYLCSCPLNICSSYSYMLEKELEFTTWKIRPQYEEKRGIDYIFVTPESLSIERILLPMDESLVPKERFPSEKQPSDHIPLCIDVSAMAISDDD